MVSLLVVEELAYLLRGGIMPHGLTFLVPSVGPAGLSSSLLVDLSCPSLMAHET